MAQGGLSATRQAWRNRDTASTLGNHKEVRLTEEEEPIWEWQAKRPAREAHPAALPCLLHKAFDLHPKDHGEPLIEHMFSFEIDHFVWLMDWRRDQRQGSHQTIAAIGPMIGEGHVAVPLGKEER